MNDEPHESSHPPAGGDPWRVGDVTLHSRFLLGTARYPSPQVLREAIVAAGTQIVTVGLKRTLAAGDNGFVGVVREALAATGARLLPNTAGCRTAREAVQLAHMAREMYDTPWIKLEVVGDEHTLQPDMFELLVATARSWCATASPCFPIAPTTWSAAAGCSMPAAPC